MLANKFSHDTNQYLEALRKRTGKEIFKTFVRGNKL